MPSAGSTSIQAPREAAGGGRAPCSRSLHTAADGHSVGFEALADREAAGREASTQPRAHSGWGRAVNATAQWLRRALAESARAWALAAGAPPDLYP